MTKKQRVRRRFWRETRTMPFCALLVLIFMPVSWIIFIEEGILGHEIDGEL
jgi:hypothetical protein